MSDERVNRVQFRGKAFKPELRYTNSGTSIGECRMSVSRNKARKGQPADWESAWFDVTAWGDAGEILGEVADRAEITVTGRLDVRTGYQKRDGTMVEPSLKITADEVIVHDGGSQRRSEPTPVDASDLPF